MKLVIAEKPSVGAAIAAVLGATEKRSGYFEGGGYLVSWCIGHLISLADAATYNEQYRKWKYDDLPIVPQEWQFIVASGKEQQFSILKDLMHRSDVTEIVNACDSGREGELIFRFVYEQANCKKPFSRLWISSMEESAIREGFSNLKDGRFGLAAWKQVQSARAFQISKTGAAMTTSINPRFAEQRPIGSLALTRPAFSLSSTIKH